MPHGHVVENVRRKNDERVLEIELGLLGVSGEGSQAERAEVIELMPAKSLHATPSCVAPAWHVEQ